MSKRPSNITDEHLEYLDALRETNAINMMGASSYLEEEFGLDRREAREINKYWMQTFGKDDR